MSKKTREDSTETRVSTLELTTGNGRPINDKRNVLTVGERGPILLQDIWLLDELAHFDAERIPERVVHAKGAGAHGVFEVTSDEIKRYCKAKLFSEVGKKTPVFVRFSTVGGEKGSADTVRDPRGFGIKFYTEDGNWDLVGNNTPVFFIRDPILFPSFIHSQKKNPATNLPDPDSFWDFISLRPETTHQVMFLFSDRGIPDGYCRMNGYGSHTFKLVNSEGTATFCKFHLKTNQGIKNLDPKEAELLAGKDPDYSTRDLFNRIKDGDCPSWTLHVQVMTLSEAESFEFNPFDVTKVWSHHQFPLIEVGILTLDRNPENYFNEVEQFAVTPSNLVPGIEVSPDKMLQARLFSYPDTHRHRLGANWEQIPINRPLKGRVHNYQRDGFMALRSESAPNYFPNSQSGPEENRDSGETTFDCSGTVGRHDSENDDNFSQPRVFYQKVLSSQEKESLAKNIADSLKMTSEHIQNRAVANFCKVDEHLQKSILTFMKSHDTVDSKIEN